MGYGKGKKKSKVAMERELAGLKASKRLCIVGTIIGVVIVVIAILAQIFIQTLVAGDSQTTAGMVGFVLIFIGGVVAAVSLIKMTTVNKDLGLLEARMRK